MPARTGCCRNTKYTTRQYDLSGNALWSFDYFNGVATTGKYVRSQAVDATQVYVAGDWTDDGTHQWSVVACGLTTGTLAWRADLKAYMAGFSYDVGDVLQVQIDPNNGRVVCLLKANSAGTSQAVVVLSTAGAILSNVIFALPSLGFGVYTKPMTSFVINQSGDYHLVNGTRQIFEWASPFSSAPSVRVLGDLTDGFGNKYLSFEISPLYATINVVKRFGGRDYYGMATQANTVGTSSGAELIFIRGIVQAAVPYNSADFDVYILQSTRYGAPTSPAYVVHDLCIDTNNGDFVLIGGPGISYTTRGSLERYNSSGVYQSTRECGGWSVSADASGNVYTAGKEQVFSSNHDPSIMALQQDGTYQWGHDNAETDSTWGHVIDYESSGPSVIRTGQSLTGSNGPFTTTNDSNFISDGCAPVCCANAAETNCHLTITSSCGAINGAVVAMTLAGAHQWTGSAAGGAITVSMDCNITTPNFWTLTFNFSGTCGAVLTSTNVVCTPSMLGSFSGAISGTSCGPCSAGATLSVTVTI